MDTPICWKCGARLADLAPPLERLAACPACRAELHACRMCRFYDPRLADACGEPVADPVADKARANFCGYFQLASAARRQPLPPTGTRSRLAELFGDDASGTQPQPGPRQRLEDLFEPDGED